jgi:hypothetical protein
MRPRTSLREPRRRRHDGLIVAAASYRLFGPSACGNVTRSRESAQGSRATTLRERNEPWAPSLECRGD